MYNAPSQKVPKRKSSKITEGGALRATAQIGAGTAAGIGGGVNQDQLVRNQNQQDEEEDFEEPQLSIGGSLVTLGLSTTLVAFCSEFMVGSIDAITASGTPSRTFVGLILLPIVGNAAEHATAVTVACKDKMDLAIGVAVGSSMQIALLVLPLAVIVGWGLDNQCMSLSFDEFQIIVLFVAVLLVNYLIQDGKSRKCRTAARPADADLACDRLARGCSPYGLVRPDCSGCLAVSSNRIGSQVFEMIGFDAISSAFYFLSLRRIPSLHSLFASAWAWWLAVHLARSHEGQRDLSHPQLASSSVSV